MIKKIMLMGTLNNCFFPYSKSKKAVISLVFAHKGGFKNIVFQTALMAQTGVFSRMFLLPAREGNIFRGNTATPVCGWLCPLTGDCSESYRRCADIRGVRSQLWGRISR